MADQVKTKCWEESPGETSAMRVGMLACVVMAFYTTLIGLHSDSVSLAEVFTTTTTYLGAGFGGKFLQRAVEK